MIFLKNMCLTLGLIIVLTQCAGSPKVMTSYASAKDPKLNDSSNNNTSTKNNINSSNDLNGLWTGECLSLDFEESSDELVEKFFQYKILVKNTAFTYTASLFLNECTKPLKEVSYVYNFTHIPDDQEQKNPLQEIELELIGAFVTLFSDELVKHCNKNKVFNSSNWQKGVQKDITGMKADRCGDESGQSEIQSAGAKEMNSYYLNANKLFYPVFSADDLATPEMLTSYERK